MKIIKLFLKTFMALSLCFGLSFSAFAQKQSQDPSDETLSIWVASVQSRDSLLKLSKSFSKNYGIQIHIDVFDGDKIVNQFKTISIAKRKGPDIIEWAHDVVGDLGGSGLLQAINLPKILKKKLYPVAIDAFTYKGKLYGYPYAIESVALIVNTSLVRNPPSSFKKLLEISEKITSKDQYGFLFDIDNFYFAFPFFSAGGGYIFKSINHALNITDIGVDNSGSIAGASAIHDLVAKGIIPPSTDYNIAIDKMLKGKLGMMINGPWVLKELRAAKIPYRVAMLPKLKGKHMKPFVGARGFMISQQSSNKDLAQLFLEEVVITKKGIQTLYEGEPRGPAHKDVATELNDKDIQMFLKNTALGVPMPNVPEMGVVWKVMENALNHIVHNKIEVAKALNNASQQIKKSIQTTQTTK